MKNRRATFSPPPDLAAYLFRVGCDELVIFEWTAESSSSVPDTLTTAEREVLLLLERGASNAEIARHRGTSVRTVGNQVGTIFRKLGVASRSELMAMRARQGGSRARLP